MPAGEKPFIKFYQFATYSSLLQCTSQGHLAGSHGVVGSASDSRDRVLGVDNRLGHIPSFLLLLIQEGSCQLLAKVCARSTG